MVRATYGVGDYEDLFLITPTEQSDSLIRMPNVVVESDFDHSVTLILKKHGCEPLRLGKGRVIGNMEAVTLEPEVEQEMEIEDGGDGCVVQVSADASLSSQRQAKLLEQLNLRIEYLTPEERQELTDLIPHHANVFA